jgi:hypothetical protein
MTTLHIFTLIIILFFITIYFIYNYQNNTEKYINLGDEVTPQIQAAAFAKLTTASPKLETIRTNMASTNNMLENIIASQNTALTGITSTVSDNISKLTNINKTLGVSIKKIKKQINGTVIPVTENFEDVSDLYDNHTISNTISNNANKKINMNDKDKLTEYFYNYVPPKQNVYEGFFDWKDDWNRKVREIGLSLDHVSIIKDGSHHSFLPIVAKKDMPKIMNETTAKIVSLAATDDERELLKAWRQDIRNKELEQK